MRNYPEGIKGLSPTPQGLRRDREPVGRKTRRAQD